MGPPHHLPVSFERLPHRPPVLRRRLHHDFVDVVLDEPRRQLPQLFRRRPHHAPLELKLPVGGDVGDHHGQHPFVHVNPGDAVLHATLHDARGGRVTIFYSGSRAPTGPTYSLNRTPRIIQFSGLTRSTGSPISPRAPALFSATRRPCSSRFASCESRRPSTVRVRFVLRLSAKGPIAAALGSSSAPH
jgi:hypothetical protein